MLLNNSGGRKGGLASYKPPELEGWANPPIYYQRNANSVPADNIHII
jgi:hypothetical protein